jgi:hypothetical protein
MHSPLLWDERYSPFIRRAYFLPLARLVNNRLPIMDFAMLMALVDRWHPETHTFHLSCGEATHQRPPDVGPNDKDKKPYVVHSGWLIASFHTCLEGVNHGVVRGVRMAVAYGCRFSVLVR